MSKGGDQNTNVYSILDIKRAGPVRNSIDLDSSTSRANKSFI